jgi:hypothetical protein
MQVRTAPWAGGEKYGDKLLPEKFPSCAERRAKERETAGVLQ